MFPGPHITSSHDVYLEYTFYKQNASSFLSSYSFPQKKIQTRCCTNVCYVRLKKTLYIDVPIVRAIQ